MNDEIACFDRAAPVALIAGASGGIGKAVLERLVKEPRWQAIYPTYNDNPRGIAELAAMDNRIQPLRLDMQDETSIEAALARVAEQHSAIGLLCCATGFLHSQTLQVQPEKRLRDLTAASMRQLMEVNCIGPALLLKHSEPLLLKQPSVAILVSAKVGSIEDNRLGGWHSYRASKAALNMVIKTASIELGRRNENLAVLAFHPGTTDTSLSKPFQKNVAAEKLFSPERCAEQLMDVAKVATTEDNGSFFGWAGERIAW